MTNIPNIEGLWEYEVTVLRRTAFEEPNLNNLVNVKTLGTITQSGDFLYLELPPDNLRPTSGFLLGVLNKEINNFLLNQTTLRLTFSDFDDNGVFNLTPSEYDKFGNITEFSGNYHESGFTGQSPTQLQTIGKITLKKVLLK